MLVVKTKTSLSWMSFSRISLQRLPQLGKSGLDTWIYWNSLFGTVSLSSLGKVSSIKIREICIARVDVGVHGIYVEKIDH